MNSIKRYLVRDGNLTWMGGLALVVIGFYIAFVSLEYLPSAVLKALGLAVGLGVAAVGGFSGRSKALGLKPFTNDPAGWRKAKKSYKVDKNEAGLCDDDGK